jgi:hypothetical protein
MKRARSLPTDTINTSATISTDVVAAHDLDMFVLVDIYLARPHLFAGSQFHMIRMATWVRWLKRYPPLFRAELKLAMKWRGEPTLVNTQFFQWDSVTLYRDPDKEYHIESDRPWGTRYFALESKRFRYVVTISYGFSYTVSYHLVKYDLVEGVVIDMLFETGMYTQSTDDLMYSDVLAYNVHIACRHQCDFISVWYEIPAGGGMGLIRAIESDSGMNISVDAVVKVIDFMKTSRLDLAAYRPQMMIKA